MRKPALFARFVQSAFCFMIASSVILFTGLPVVARADTPATVRLWNWNIADKKYQQNMYKLFNQRHPEIKIEYSSISTTVYDQVLEAAFIAKEPPDLFLSFQSGKLTFDYLQTRGLVMPLNDAAPSAAELKDWMAQFPPNLNRFAEGRGTVNGQPYVVDLASPEIGAAGFPLYYNKTLFNKAGIEKPPATQSEMRQSAAKITQTGQGKYFGISHGLKYRPSVWHQDLAYSLAYAAGVLGKDGPEGPPDLRDGKYKMSSPAFIKAFEAWIGMRKDGSVYPGETLMDDEQAKMAFATDKAAMFFGGTWVPGNVLTYNPEADFDVVLAPTPDDGIRRGLWNWVPPKGASGYVIARSARYPRAVWEVIRFISSLEYQEGWVKGGYGVSYLPEANRPENFTVPQMYKFVQWPNDPALRRIGAPDVRMEAWKVLTTVPPLYPTYSDVLENVYLGKSGYDALRDLDARLDAGLAAAIKKAQENGVKVSIQDFIFPDWDPMKDYPPKAK